MDKKTIFIDWHQTLSTDRLLSSYSDDTQGLPLRKAFDESVFNNETLFQDWLRGHCNSEHIVQTLCNFGGFNFDQVWPLFIQDCKRISLFSPLDQKLLQLKEKYNTILVTDNMDCFSRFTLPAQNLHIYFHAISNSSECNLMKKDDNGKIFSQLAQQHRVDIKNCILIDDNEDLSRMFTQLGGTSFRVTDPKHTVSILNALLAA